MPLPQKVKNSMMASTLLRLTFWHVLVLALFTATLSSIIYMLISSAFYARSDGVLSSITSATVAILRHDLSESGIEELAARDAVRILNFPGITLCIYDSYGNVLAEKPLGGGRAGSIAFPAGMPPPDEKIYLYTIPSSTEAREPRRIAAAHVTLEPGGRDYIVLASQSLDTVLNQLERRRRILLVTALMSIVAAGFASWFLIRRSFAPVIEMSERALHISATNLDERFHVGNAKDELSRLAATFNDLLSRLSTSLALQRHFMADTSHEMRTPLSIICCAASVTLKLDEPTRDDYQDSLRLIQQEGRRLTQIVEDMFCLARADSGGLKIESTEFDLDELLLDAVHAIDWLASTKNIKAQIDSLDESPAHGDPHLLRRIFLNLLANAVKHTPPRGRIFVRLETLRDRYRVSIRDTGEGIPEEHHSLIFQRFYRVTASGPSDDDLSNFKTGAGLGLPIARMLAQAHGGDVTLQYSDRQGSTFVCDLPIMRKVQGLQVPATAKVKVDRASQLA